ncbi:MAG: dihydroneopterin aldolase [Bacteroidaceae bacterium]|nr:dihydroneopterin aldolase [Bacteroidaceae bacterium]
MKIKEQTITLDSLRFYAYHGAEPQEAIVGAWYTVDIDMKADVTDAILNDNLSGTINYAQVAETVKQQMEIRSALLEHVAGRIAQSLFEKYSKITELTVRVNKEKPPVGIPCSQASVEITAVR